MAPPSYVSLEAEVSAGARNGPGEAARPPPLWASILFDVDDGPMLHKREVVMNTCIAQIVLSFVLVTNYRRSPVLLILQPFFIGAGVLGYLGARDCKALFVAAHFIGSAGLALVFLLFILAETFLKHTQGQQHASSDLFFIVINAPMDVFLLTSSVASVVLFLSLRQLRRQLRRRREEVRERFDAHARGEAGEAAEQAYPGGRGGVPAGLAGILPPAAMAPPAPYPPPAPSGAQTEPRAWTLSPARPLSKIQFALRQ